MLPRYLSRRGARDQDPDDDDYMVDPDPDYGNEEQDDPEADPRLTEIMQLIGNALSASDMRRVRALAADLCRDGGRAGPRAFRGQPLPGGGRMAYDAGRRLEALIGPNYSRLKTAY
jgi:hypothetical protein